MNLHVESRGNGQPLLLIHGWGMHGGVWNRVVQQLESDFRVHIIDLPGYGYSSTKQGQTLDRIVDEVSACFTEPLSVCGWSLGGQVALRWARCEPDKVRRLILVSSTPCFNKRVDWNYGLDSDVLERFVDELEQNHATTLRRFIALQLRGSEKERELMVLMRGQLFSRGEPDMGALRAGLNILLESDLRDELQDIKQPVLVIAGDKDKLTPIEASYYLSKDIPDARVVEVTGAAHAPFLSHPTIFVEQVKSFLHE